MTLTPTPRTGEAIPRRRQPPVAPLPDFRHVFIEPVYSGPGAAEVFDEEWQEEHRAADRQR
ncbi:hypothetical protein [Streptomyces pristinaespiralis]|uniref:hypothetical protein n=1 Tax=Streptomyces pristinaespiralis TaxID=38300 RepID=UPI0038332215